METQTYTSPRDYIQKAPYTSIKVPLRQLETEAGKVQLSLNLSDLEKAIIGYVAAAPLQVNGISPKPGIRTYNEIHELVFEYFKIYEPKKIKYAIARFITSLKSNKDRLKRPLVQQLLTHYRRLKNENPSQISYEDFYPKDFKKALPRERPLRKDYGDIIRNLNHKGLIQSGGGGRGSYFNIGPWAVKLKLDRNL